MHNAGPKVQQDFFFPVERWERNRNAHIDPIQSDIVRYQISVDGKDLKSTNVAGRKQESSKTKEGTSDTNEGASKANQASSQAEREGGQTTSRSVRQQGHSTSKWGQ